MSSASTQKLFCGIYSAFRCSFDEFVGEKVVSPSYSSTILGLPLILYFYTNNEHSEKEIMKTVSFTIYSIGGGPKMAEE